MIKRILLFTAVAGIVLVAGGSLYTRTAAMDPSVWHVDPELGQRTGKPNDILIGPGGDRPALVLDEAPAEVAARIDAIALAEPGTERLAGAPEEGLTTYVQRSRLMGFPDAISVRVAPEGEGSRVSIWSRSRFGQSDMGVNAARVDRWLAALQ
jgi:hypothetical protein